MGGRARVPRQVSKDGTRKWLIRMAPGIEVETVYIPDVGRAGALCVSSQVGCTLICTFCHTGTQALVQLLKGIPAKINLIPFNPWPGSRYECSDWEQIEKFSEVVFNAGYASPVRTPRGRDILAACGQLKSESEKLRASARRKAPVEG